MRRAVLAWWSTNRPNVAHSSSQLRCVSQKWNNWCCCFNCLSLSCKAFPVSFFFFISSIVCLHIVCVSVSNRLCITVFLMYQKNFFLMIFHVIGSSFCILTACLLTETRSRKRAWGTEHMKMQILIFISLNYTNYNGTFAWPLWIRYKVFMCLHALHVFAHTFM